MLRDEATEMNPKIFLFVNPYEVNPGSFRAAQPVNSGSCQTSTCQNLPISVKTDSGGRSSCEYLEEPSVGIKLEMEEFSDLGDLIPLPERARSAMDELDFQIADPEGMTNLTMHTYDSQSMKDLVGAQDFHKCEFNQQQQMYIDNNHHVNLDDISGEEFSILQQELSASSCANRAPSEPSNNNNNNDIDKIIKQASLRDRDNTSNIFNFEGGSNAFVVNDDHGYAITSSPSEASVAPQYSPLALSESSDGQPNRQQPYFRQRLSGLNLGVKLFVGDTLNTPDILESVVSLEDDRFNFLRNLEDDQKLQTINENDLFFQLPQTTPQADVNCRQAKVESNQLSDTRWTPTPEEFEEDEDDEDYVPPKRTRVHKKLTKTAESDSDEDYVPTKSPKKRTRRTSSISSDSSKDSGRVSKYRELRDKNNEASRKSRLKRKVKEQQMEMEMQELESENVKLKAKVEELKRMVDNFRSNLFKIMASK